MIRVTVQSRLRRRAELVAIITLQMGPVEIDLRLCEAFMRSRSAVKPHVRYNCSFAKLGLPWLDPSADGTLGYGWQKAQRRKRYPADPGATVVQLDQRDSMVVEDASAPADFSHSLTRCWARRPSPAHRRDGVMLVNTPEPGRVVLAPRKQVCAVGRERGIAHAVCMADELTHFLAGLRVPEPCDRIAAAGHDILAIR